MYLCAAMQTTKPIIIAIDGYSSCGKSTLAKDLAAQLHFAYIDSGAMYRAVTLYFLRHNIALHDDEAIKTALHDIHITFKRNKLTQSSETYLNGENIEAEIRGMAVSNVVSEVSAIKAVRKSMVALQRKAGKHRGVVMDGRDIGTNVFADAELKIFLTAEPTTRAERRFLELQQKGDPETMQAVINNLAHRDHIDTTRTENPLRQAETARIIDNTRLTPQQQLELAHSWAMEVMVEDTAINEN